MNRLCLIFFILILSSCAFSPKAKEAESNVNARSLHSKKSYKKTNIKNVIAKHKGFMNCKNKYPSSKGLLSLNWEIKKDGSVGKVTVLRSLGSELDQCMIKEIKSLSFPKPPKNTTAKISYPFLFK